MKLHEALAYARECKGITLRDLERETGISNATLSEMESGRITEPSFRKVVKVARVLGVSVERLATTE